jgi:signal transduction histidine kinase
MAHIFGMMFLNQIFPTKFMKPLIKVNTILFAGAAILLFFLPPYLFTYEMLVFQPVLLLFLVFYLVKGFIGTLRGKVMDGIFFISLGLFIYALVNDILLANTAGAIHNNYLTQVSFQVFIFAMSVLIIMQWVRNYNTRLQLESSLRFKNRVLSVIAHDLKNPVASVAQFSELLADKPDLAREDHIINSLKESSQAAVTLLDNLLYWGRSQADELSVNAAMLDVEKLVRDVQSLYVHMMGQKQIDFKVDMLPGINGYGDKALVNIVLRNLLSNAIKFTPKGGAIQVQIYEEGEFVTCKVIDNGVGIKSEILEEFEKNGLMGSSTGTDREVGTGLGLQLVRDLVSKNGGDLEIKSELQKGSTFSFTIPKYK